MVNAVVRCPSLVLLLGHLALVSKNLCVRPFQWNYPVKLSFFCLQVLLHCWLVTVCFGVDWSWSRLSFVAFGVLCLFSEIIERFQFLEKVAIFLFKASKVKWTCLTLSFSSCFWPFSKVVFSSVAFHCDLGRRLL